MTDFSISGEGSDWANFIHAASIGGMIDHLCIDVIGNVITASAEVDGKHIWALTQSWLFDTKGSGSFVVKVDHALKALKLMSSNKIWTAVENSGDIVFTSQQGDEVKMQLLDLNDHRDPNNNKSSYVLPKANVDNQRWVTRLIIESGLPIPVPAYQEKTDPYEPVDQRLTLDKTEWVSQMKAAKDIESDLIQLQTFEGESALQFFLQAGRQIGKKTGKTKLTGRAKVPVVSVNGTMNWSGDYDRSYLERIVSITNAEKIHVAMSSHKNQQTLWIGSHLTGSRPATENDPAITMACYYVGSIE